MKRVLLKDARTFPISLTTLVAKVKMVAGVLNGFVPWALSRKRQKKNLNFLACCYDSSTSHLKTASVLETIIEK